MRVLVLGGSVFLGRAVVGEALARGAEVTVFNRGVSGPPSADVEHLIGDRTVPADLEQLRGRAFDVVVDTCGYVPADVARGAEVLADTAASYAFVSSISAYPGWPAQPDYHAGGVHAGDADATTVPDGTDAGSAYGWLKVGCELAVLRAFGDRASVLRAGCIVGPDDGAVGRLPWWIARVARGGEVLVPGAPDDPVSLIDARDLARFALRAPPGTFETSGPVGRDTWAGLMTACATVTGSSATFTYVDDTWLAAQAIEAWTELPLWISHAEGPGVWAHDPAAAVAAGLTWRPLAETVADTWAWQRRGEWRPAPRTPGLAAHTERDLLASWRSR